MATKTAAKSGGAKKTASLKRAASSSAGASSSSAPASAAALRKEVRFKVTSRTPFEKLVKELERQLTFKKPGIGGCNPCFSGLDRVIIENPETMRKLR